MAKLSVHKSDADQLSLASFESLLARRLKIPEYQRPYAWRKDHISELFETIGREFKFNPAHVTKHNGAPLEPCFLGPIIFCSPDKEQKPTVEEYLVIDGQQRIISLLVILRFMLYEIKEIITKLENSNEEKEDDDEEILFQIKFKEKEINRHLKTVKIERDNPRNEDDEEKILYYINQHQDRDSIQEIEEKILEHIRDGFDYIKDKEKFNEGYTNLLDQANFYVQLADHILNHIQFCWLYIEGEKSEEYAIDMFNIMNSTGEPLTGFDILQSTLYKRSKKLGDKASNIEKNILDHVKHNRRQFINHTGKLILFLSIYRDDNNKDVVSDKKVIDQKRYIQKICTDETTSEKICSDLESIYNFYINKWVKKEHPYNKEAGFCFNLLIDLRHDRTLPVLLKFDEESNEIDDAIKTCTAFSVIWRVLHDAGTGGVDNKYIEAYRELKDKVPTVELLREILKVEISRMILGKYVGFSENKELKEEWKKPSDNLGQYLANLGVTQEKAKSYLEKEWKKKLKDIPIYHKNKKLTRFLLLLSSNQLTYGEDGSLKRTRGFNLLNPDIYNNKDEDQIYKTMEHIIPQRPETEDDAIDNVHTLGNLTLIPHAFNASLQNINFEKKKARFEEIIRGETEDTLPYLPILKEIVYNYESFSKKEVDERTEMLSEFIWDTLVTDWLGWK